MQQLILSTLSFKPEWIETFFFITSVPKFRKYPFWFPPRMTPHFAYPYSSPLKFPSFLVTCFPFILFSLLIEWSEDFNEFIDGRLASPGFHRPFQWSGHGRLPCNIFYACLNGRSLNNVGMNRVKWQMSLSRIPRFYSPELREVEEWSRYGCLLCACPVPIVRVVSLLTGY